MTPWQDLPDLTPCVVASGLLLNVRLIHASCERQEWARSYECETNDIQTHLGGIAGDLLTQLDAGVTPEFLL